MGGAGPGHRGGKQRPNACESEYPQAPYLPLNPTRNSNGPQFRLPNQRRYLKDPASGSSPRLLAAIYLGTMAVLIVAGLSLDLSLRGILVLGVLLTLAALAGALWLLPVVLLKLVTALFARLMYRIELIGAANIPEEGEALLVPNHVSLVDAFLLVASTDRHIHFLVSERIFSRPGLKQLAKLMEWIPISSSGSPRALIGAMNQAASFLDQGKVVCIFPEGQLTRTGMMLPFKQGFERIVKGRNTPIIPVHLGQVWGSIFSRAGGRYVWKIPRKVPYPVTVSFGSPLPTSSSVFEVRQAIRELGADAWIAQKPRRVPLQRSFIRSARRRPRALAFADEQRPKVSRFAALTGAIALARRMRTIWGGDRCVGIMLPPSVPAALLNLAATLSGRTVVNLNYTAGQDGLDSAARQASLGSVVTSELFLEKAGVTLPESLTPIWIEDVAAGITAPQRLAAAMLALVAPAGAIERFCGATRATRMDDTVAIIFSSGSTGEPKGVMLSHFNIDANVEGSAQAMHILPGDRILGVLPLFHSFGYMVTLWFAANYGMGVIYHPNPLDAAVHGQLIRRYRITMLASTPTFLQIYMKRTDPGQLGSLRIALVGAEKLSDRVSNAFQERFGLKPLEGYGATECSPIIAVSLPDHRTPGFFQAGSRSGFVGRALPGVAVRAVDPDTLDESLEPLPSQEPGMLLVRGPNVMQGYLGREDLTTKALRDGWYVTGDIGLIDEDGFIRITDRLSRFSKIGGEMFPHGRVEEALHEAVGSELQVFAVTSVPDERKGERLVVLHTVEDAVIPTVIDGLQKGGLPNLFIPRAENFVSVEALPLLGTGKIDLRGVRKIALDQRGD